MKKNVSVHKLAELVKFPYHGKFIPRVLAGSDFCCASDTICQHFALVVLTRVSFVLTISLQVAFLPLFGLSGRFFLTQRKLRLLVQTCSRALLGHGARLATFTIEYPTKRT